MAKEKKERYKPNKVYKITEFCDTYHIKKKGDDHLLATYNPTFKIIYISKVIDEEAIVELENFCDHKKWAHRRLYSPVKEIEDVDGD